MLLLAIASLLVSSGGVLAWRDEAPVAAPAVAAPEPAFHGSAVADVLLEPAARALASGLNGIRARALALAGEPCGDPSGRLVRFRVHVQEGLPISEEVFALGVRAIVCDERSWIASGRVRFAYDPDGPTLVELLDAATTEAVCMRLIGLSVHRTYSCAGFGRAVLNADRWFGGSPTWPGSVDEYRRLLVNHEIGHVLGQRHRGCPGVGSPAPAMMQQSKGLDGCVANPWPTPAELAGVR